MPAAKITIVVRGDTESDMSDAIADAVRKITEGFTSGSDRCETGGYYFDVNYDVPEAELPA